MLITIITTTLPNTCLCFCFQFSRCVQSKCCECAPNSYTLPIPREKMTDKNYSSEESCSDSEAELLNNSNTFSNNYANAITWNGINNPLFPKKKLDPHRRLSLNNLVGRMNQGPRTPPAKIDPFFQPKILRKNNSITRTESIGSLAKESKVLVIYTGGTIGMVKNANGGMQVLLHYSLSRVIILYFSLYSNFYFFSLRTLSWCTWQISQEVSSAPRPGLLQKIFLST